MRFPLVRGYLQLANVNEDELLDELGMVKRTFLRKLDGETEFTLSESLIIANACGRSIEEVFLPSDV